MATKLPFTFTPQISRYIAEIIKDYNKRSEGLPKNQKVTPFPIFFDTYKEEEYVAPHNEEMRLNFVNYLIKEQAIESLAMPKQTSKETEGGDEFYNNFTEEELNDTTRFFIKNFGFRILDIKPILAVLNYKLKHPNANILTEATELRDLRLGQCEEEIVRKKIKRVVSFGKKTRNFYKPILRLIVKELWVRRSHVCKTKETNGSDSEPVSLEELVKILKINNDDDIQTLPVQLHNIQNNLLSKFSSSILLETKGMIQIKVTEV